MDKELSFSHIRGLIKKIWLIVFLGFLIGAVAGGAMFKLGKQKQNYTASASLFVDRKFAVDQNGNGFYDEDAGRFFGDYLSFIEYPTFIKELEEKYPGYQEQNLDKKYPNFSNVLELTYQSTDKVEAMGVVNALVEQIKKNSDELMAEKGSVTVIKEPTEENLIVSPIGSLSSRVLMGAIYGLIIGLILSFIKVLFIKK